MLGEDCERFLYHFVRLLKVTSFPQQKGRVIAWLKEIRHICTVEEVRLCLVEVSLSQLKHSQVVEGLSMVGVIGDGYFKGLIGKSKVSNADADMTDIEPDITHVGVVRDS